MESIISANLAYVSLALFVIALFTLHFLKPEFDPKWRMISEYEIGKYGFVMRVAFFLWGIGVLATLIRMNNVPSGFSILIFIWLVIIVIALFGAGIFKTDPIVKSTNSLTNAIHTLCGTIVILTFPIIATIICIRYIRSALISVPTILIGNTIFVWLGQISFFSSIAISRRTNQQTENFGPRIYLGWPNRIMVFSYVLWMITVNATLVI